MLQDFYNNLFAVEITILGIVTAAVFVSLQILYTNYSYRQIFTLFRNVPTVFYVTLSPIVILVTGLASFFLSVEHNFLPTRNLLINALLLNAYSAVILLAIFFTTIGLGFFIIIKSISRLNPSTLLLDYKRNLTKDKISRFLFKRYGLPEPYEINFFRKIYSEQDLLLASKAIEERIKIDLTTGAKILLPEDQEILGPGVLEAKKNFQEAQIRYKKIQKEIIQSQDVFEGFSFVLAKAIFNGDVRTINTGCESLNEIAECYIPDKEADIEDGWRPTSILPDHFAKYIAEFLRVQIDTCIRYNIPSLALYFIRMSKVIVLILIKKGYDSSAKNLLAEWKKLADEAIEKGDRLLFNEIMFSYDVAADVLFEKVKKQGEENRMTLDDIFRHLGWLSERLLTKKGIEERPIMYDQDYFNEHDSLIGNLIKYSYSYRNDLPGFYPLVYFDAIWVLFNQLLKMYKSGKLTEGLRKEVENNIFDCIHTYSAFGEAAIQVDNSPGAGLAVSRLREVFDEIKGYPAEPLLGYALSEIVSLTIAAGSSENLVRVDFLTKPIAESLEELIVDTPWPGIVAPAVNEKYLRTELRSHQKRWAYIKSLGVKMNSNFGFMFDPTTGEDYAEDDPRRR